MLVTRELSNDYILETRDLKKYFPLRGPWGRTLGQIRAVDGVSIGVRAGETLSIVGESGCGKTTTARLLLLLERATGGEVLFERAPIASASKAAVRNYRSSVQAVFQDPWSSMNPRMRVRDVIGEPLLISTKLTKRQINERIREFLPEVGLDESALDKYPHEFSGGQRQRIAVARALILQPRVVILDEPVSALDVSIRAQIMNLLRDLQERLAISYILIAHDLATVRYLSTRIAVMYLGRVVESGPSETVFTSPAHPYTHALISASRPAEPAEDENRIVLYSDIPSPANMPSGCRFHTRCWLRKRLGDPDRCVSEEPRARIVSTDRAVACHYAEELLGGEGVSSERAPTAPVVS